MTLLRRLSRILRLTGHTVKAVTLVIWHTSEVHNGIPSEKYQAIKQQWLKQVCEILNIKVQQHGNPLETPALYASNHVSWLDIPVIGCLTPISFLSKSEVETWPVIGWLTRKSGTLFIKRGFDGAARQALEEIERHLKAGQHILIFPEGTTTDGSKLRNFHPRLFAVAIEQDIDVQPVAIRYTDSKGKLSQIVPFIDNMAFIRNLWRILGEEVIFADVHFLTPIIETKELQRKTLAGATQDLISNALEL